MTVSLKDYSREEIERMALIDLANDLLLERKKALNFHDTFEEVADIKGLSKAKKAESISQFYTDLNLDGRFLTLGSNVWGLKRWYPVDQIDEEVAMAPKKKKKSTKKSEENLDLDDELLEEEELEDEGLVEIFDDAPAFKSGSKDEDDEDDEDDDKKVFSEGFGIEGEEEEDDE